MAESYLFALVTIKSKAQKGQRRQLRDFSQSTFQVSHPVSAADMWKRERENLKPFSEIPIAGGLNQLQAVFSFSIAGAVVTIVCAGLLYGR